MAKERTNLWLYSSQTVSANTAGSMIVLGAEVFKRAKIVRDIDLIDEIFKNLAENRPEPYDERFYEFIFEYVVDCVRILIFFENYLKGELINKGYCIHQINKDIPGFVDLARQQRERPILLQEIEAIELFTRNDVEERMTHRAIKETTISMKELLSFEYVKHCMASDEILGDVAVLNATRNRLHLLDSIEFQLFKELANKIRRINEFVDQIISERIVLPNT